MYLPLFYTKTTLNSRLYQKLMDFIMIIILSFCSDSNCFVLLLRHEPIHS